MLVVCILAVIGAVSGRSNDGFSSINRQDDGQGNYHYNYDITDWDTNHRRWETVDANNNRRGGYTITDVDGKVRQVEYTADKNGFRAIVKTNEHGTKAHVAGDQDAVYVNDGVRKIIQDAQPALQQTGHILKQKKLGHVHREFHAAPIVPAVPVAPVITHQIQPAVVRVHQPIVQTVVQPLPVVVHRPAIQETVIQRAPERVVHVHQPVVTAAPRRTVAYTPFVAKPQPVFEHVHRVVHQPVVRVEQPIARPVVPAVREEVVSHHVASIPAYTGPRRRPQRPVEDPAQAFETPEEKVILTPKRVPAYSPDQDLPEDFVPTVRPPASRSRVAYAPERVAAPLRSASITRFAPIALRPVYQPVSYGPPVYQTSYQPVPLVHSGCARCGGYKKSKSR